MRRRIHFVVNLAQLFEFDRSHKPDTLIKLLSISFQRKSFQDANYRSPSGTPDQIAPELLTSNSYTNAVDWWSLGMFVDQLSA